MTYIVPSDLSRLSLSGAHNAGLKAELTNDFTVFHGVHWSREYEAWTHRGEIDFVGLNVADLGVFLDVFEIEHEPSLVTPFRFCCSPAR